MGVSGAPYLFPGHSSGWSTKCGKCDGKGWLQDDSDSDGDLLKYLQEENDRLKLELMLCKKDKEKLKASTKLDNSPDQEQH